MRAVPSAPSCAELDVTPMIGVLLALLIVVMTTLPTMKTMDATPWSPASHAPCICDDGPVLLEVLPGPVYRVNDEPVEAARLLAHLTRIYGAQTEKEIAVEGYPGVSYGEVVTAIDIAKSAGTGNVAIPRRDFYLPAR